MKEEFEKAEGSVRGCQKEGAWAARPGLGSEAPLSQARTRPRGHRGTLLGLFQGEWVPMGSVWMARSPGNGAQGWPQALRDPTGPILRWVGELRLLLQPQPSEARRSVMQ